MRNLLSALKTKGVLPDQVSFDEYILTWFCSLWRLSLISPVREHGAALVEVSGCLTVAAARPGNCAAFYLNESEMGLGGFMGYSHTHPYETGTTGVAFSPGDFACMIYHQMGICIVQSGDYLFMLAQTPATPACVEPEKIFADFDRWLAHYQRRGRKWQAAVLLADLHLCREYSLAFYEGRMHQPLRLLQGGE